MSSSPTHAIQSSTGRVDEIDAFLTQIESKLRQPYSSLELTKPSTGHFSSLTTTTTTSSSSSTFASSGTTSSTQSQQTHLTPREIVQNMDRCFPLMTQSIRLRCIIGLLGLEPNVAQLYGDDKFDEILEEFFQKISMEEKDMGQTLEQRDPWIPVLAGIVQGKMFCKVSHEEEEDVAAAAAAAATASSSSRTDRNTNAECLYRNRKTDAVLKKSVDVIMQSIMEASNDAVNFRNEAEVALTKCLGDKDESDMEKLLDSFHIGSDINPHYVPWCYRLCSEDVVREAIPELDDRCDFITNCNADILQVDERVDRIKALEEKKEQEEKEKMKAMAQERKRKMNAAAAAAAAAAAGSNGRDANRVPGSKNNANMRGNGTSVGSNSTAELLMRSKVKSGATPSNVAGSSSSSSSRPLAPITSVVAGGRPRLSGLGRGAAANAIGGRSLANPMSQIKRPMVAKGVLGMPGLRRGTALAGASTLTAATTSTTTTSAAAATLATNKSRTKMKMIDVSEVEGLKKEEDERNKRLSEEEIRENKRRKILEKAVAKGLKVKNMGDIKNNVEKDKS